MAHPRRHRELVHGEEQAASFWKRPTPKHLGSLIVFLALIDLAVLSVRVKQTVFPVSMDWLQYGLWLEDLLFTWTGRLFWIGAIAASVLLLIRGRKVKRPEISEAVVGSLNRFRKALAKLAVALPILALVLAALPAIVILVKPELRSPATAGQIVIPTDRDSSLLYRVVNEGDDHIVVAYNRAQNDSAGRLQSVGVFRPSEAGYLDNIALTSDSKRLFVTDSQAGKVWIFDPNHSVVESGYLSVARTARPLSLSGDGRKLYVGVVGPIPEGRIDVFDHLDAQDVHSIRKVATIRSIGCPVDLFSAGVSPLLFVATQCGGGQDALYVVDTRTDMIVRRVPGFAVATNVVATPEASKAFVLSLVQGLDGGTVSRLTSYTPGKQQIQQILEAPSVTAMTPSPNGTTLFVGVTVHEKGGFIDIDPYGRFPFAATASNPPPAGAILSLNVKDGKPCGSEPLWLENAPSALVIGPDDALFAPLKHRFFVSDYKPFACK